MCPNVVGRQQETMGKHNVTVLDIGQAGQHNITNNIPVHIYRICVVLNNMVACNPHCCALDKYFDSDPNYGPQLLPPPLSYP